MKKMLSKELCYYLNNSKYIKKFFIYKKFLYTNINKNIKFTISTLNNSYDKHIEKNNIVLENNTKSIHNTEKHTIKITKIAIDVI